MAKASKVLIIGAGLSGLTLAQKLLAQAPHRVVTLFDKAKGVGGRLATRRTDDAKFDHGAQFYRLKDPLRPFHARWLQRGVVKLWFEDQNQQHYVASDGMTALAKDLAADLQVCLEERVISLTRSGDQWLVNFESGRQEATAQVVFTCPTPQTIEIFERSGLSYSAELKAITYSKALVLLIENSAKPFKPADAQFAKTGYSEPKDGFFFSLADQSTKGVSRVNALTATLSPTASEEFFDRPEVEVIERIVRELKKLSPTFAHGVCQLKKWRYCQVQKTYGELFAEPTQNLFLIGDGFGGASLNGAARSAEALAAELQARDARA